MTNKFILQGIVGPAIQFQPVLDNPVITRLDLLVFLMMSLSLYTIKTT